MARTATAAETLAEWATTFDPRPQDLELADRSLKDTAAVIWAARDHELRQLFDQLSPTGRLAALAHVHDFDDLHMPSTAHISAICVPAAIEGGARAYLAGAGVMARLGTALGWRHYSAGWHATCTAGTPAAAVAASIARNLDAERVATAIALAVPAAGGVQRAFGSASKALQVGFAAEAGVRAAALADAGATADPETLGDWIELVGGDPGRLVGGDPGRLVGGDPGRLVGGDPGRLEDGDAGRLGNGDTGGPGKRSEAIPGGLAIKLYPCCYALQRPIAALVELLPLDPRQVKQVRITTPKASLTPLIHSTPATGLKGKFSLEYGVATTILDGPPTLGSFTDQAVRRPEAQRLMELIETAATDHGEQGLLDGELTAEIELHDDTTRTHTLKLPPGAPDRPPTDEELGGKLEACAGPDADELATLTWNAAASRFASLPRRV